MSATTGRFAIPRSRGVLTGGTIVILGIWGAIIPFVGPYFHYGFGSYAHLHFTWERLWLNVVPGVAAILGGVLLITTANRPTGVLGGWLSALAGVWFMVGVSLSTIWQGAGNSGIGPALGGHLHQAAEWVGFFYGLGAAITFLAAFSMGRLSVRDVDLSGDWADSDADRPDEHEADREQQIPAATA